MNLGGTVLMGGKYIGKGIKFILREVKKIKEDVCVDKNVHDETNRRVGDCV